MRRIEDKIPAECVASKRRYGGLRKEAKYEERRCSRMKREPACRSDAWRDRSGVLMLYRADLTRMHGPEGWMDGRTDGWMDGRTDEAGQMPVNTAIRRAVMQQFFLVAVDATQCAKLSLGRLKPCQALKFDRRVDDCRVDGLMPTSADVRRG